MADKVIITCAVTGSIHTPTMSPHLPITPDEIAEASIGAWEAGASIIHLHARDPRDGSPTPDPDTFMAFLPRIKQATDAVVNITTGGGHGMSLQERLAAPLRASPEMTSLNMGSMNFGLYPILDRISEFQYEWERTHLENSRDFIFRNTFKDIEYILKELGEGHGVRFEFECYDIGHLYNLAHFLDRGLVKPPLFVQSIFGILGGVGADEENLMHSRRIANKLFGSDYRWSVLAAGRPPDELRDHGGDARRQCPGRAWRTVSTLRRASSRSRTATRWPRSGGSSRTSRSRSPPRQRPGPCSG